MDLICFSKLNLCDVLKSHPARRRDPAAFTFTVERAGERPLTRQMREAQKIANEAPGTLINGRYEHIPPAIRPLTPGHLLDREALRGEQIRGAGQWQLQRSCQDFKNFHSTVHFVSILFHFCIPFLPFLTSWHTMTCLTRMLSPSKSFVSVVN